MTSRQYRQGDLLFVEVPSVPDSARSLRHRIIAEGEATGHRHQLAGNTAELYEDGTVMFLKVIDWASIIHEEHDEIRLPEGAYRVVRQREYQPETPRFVRD
jgi:hypothetical protein